jgi:membrane dipeptidase
MLIVDAHLDLSSNALGGRDILRPAGEQPLSGNQIATVGLPDLHAGDVRLVCATIYTAPSIDGGAGYRNADEAYTQGQQHLTYYQQQESAGTFRYIRWREDLPTGAGSEGSQRAGSAARPPLNAILLMEGADPLRTPADLAPWFDAGLRIVGMAWKRTRYAGGTGVPGPLTPEGVAMVPTLDRFGMIHDASHLAEQSFWQLLELTRGPVMASHSNCRSIVPGDRQLSDEMVRAITARGGVIGINFFDRFLLPPAEYGSRRANLTDVVRHMKHICELAGDAKHVAIGTDMDGGLGRNEIPEEIHTSADLPKLVDALTSAGFTDADIMRIMAGNWLEFFRRSLPTCTFKPTS